MTRLIYLRQQEERALRALSNREWWNGRTWRPKGTLPRTDKEAAAYRTAHDRLAEIVDAMVGGDDPVRKAKNFSQSANAARKVDARKDESRDAWTTLVARFTEARLLGRADKVLIGDCVEELKRGRFTTRTGKQWEREGVKSFLRRRRARL